MSTAVKSRSSGFATIDFVRPPNPASIPFKMPKVSVGTIVNWYQRCNPQIKPIPCVVMAIEGPRHVRLASVGAGLMTNDRGVRHAGDPVTVNPHEQVNGCWDFTDEYKQREEERAEHLELVAAVRGLLSCVNEMAESLGVAPPDVSLAEEQSDEPITVSPEEAERLKRELEAAMAQDIGLVETESE